MKTRELVIAKIKSRLAEGEPMPLFTAKEVALYEVLDEMKKDRERPFKPHEAEVFEDKLRCP